ncbi:hypothetical protein EG346_04220 [Chryseobacterium carnipullorum]|uniref:Lipoprotein n=1 Tax=Chryseobacterium carnipullorum TaxID=1124835 RepID=A0A376EJE7_CHRCU|nr:hypothetical protein [Chryseobacterium carnipullorum]AZA47436.1 hypothetical protein EG346_04220 [Chryseobacterium carnipullorum]AZA66774.1 hypothetical protein EG345_20340 [Chryseobacterium carnipullorum]STD09955.1 Uncharacterised protein [Chryseobacterium carnipullorum]
MKKLILIPLFFVLISCVGSDTEFLPQTISESKSKNLFIKEYKPTENKVTINQGDYEIVEAFTTFKLNSKNDQTINKNFFAFSVRIKNLKTGKAGLSVEDSDHSQFLNFYCDFCGGINNDNVVLYYDDISNRESLNSIKIGFKDGNKNEKVVYFVQKR